MACNPLAEVARPQISNIAINKTVVTKVSNAVFEHLEAAGNLGKQTIGECELQGGVERCVK